MLVIIMKVIICNAICCCNDYNNNSAMFRYSQLLALALIVRHYLFNFWYPQANGTHSTTFQSQYTT